MSPWYIIVFSGLAVLCVVAGVTVMTRNKSQLQAEDHHSASDKERAKRKAKRAQSRAARRKR